MPTQVDASTLQMALVGYRAQAAQIDAKMQEIRKRLRGVGAAADGGGDIPTPFNGRRMMSAAARKRIAAAQKARWAAYRAKSGAGKKQVKAKRTFSPEAKAKLAANLAKARAAKARKAAA